MIKQTKKSVDWEAIEKDWRAGLMTKLQMSELHGVSRAAIDKHFSKLGIERDLKEKIRQKAEALVTQQTVTQSVTNERLVTTEKEIVEVNAQLQANVLLAHRKDIQRGRSLLMSLITELEAETADPNLFHQLANILLLPDADATKPEVDRLAKMQAIFDRIMSSPGRVDALKKLSDTMKNLIALERQALGLVDGIPVTPEEEQISRIERVIVRKNG